MNTTENNKLIAEFMGFTLRGLNTYEKDNILYMSADLKFHNDWNWLMQAVEECLNRQEDTLSDLYFILNDALVEVNINSLYMAVVNLIRAINTEELEGKGHII